MKALVYHGPVEGMCWEDWPDPEPGPGEALIAPRAVCICGSDLHGYTGESGRRNPPMVMGHETTGVVVGLGPGVPEKWLGMRVVVWPAVVCGRCEQCLTDHPNLCRNVRGIGRDISGAMAERMVMPVTNLRQLPDSLSLVHGALTEPLGVALHASRRAGDLSGRSVLITGSGPIGLLTLVACLQANPRVVVTADLVPRRRAAAMALGADAALDPTVEGWREQLAEAVGKEEVDVTIDAVGTPVAFQQGLSVLRPGGTLVAIGGWSDVPLDLDLLMHLELEVTGSYGFLPAEFEEAMFWLEEGRFDPDEIITDVLPLVEVGESIFVELTQHRRPESIKVVLIPPEVKE